MLSLHTDSQAHTHTRTHARARTRTHTHSHSHSHSHTHTQTHGRTTHTHTRMQPTRAKEHTPNKPPLHAPTNCPLEESGSGSSKNSSSSFSSFASQMCLPLPFPWHGESLPTGVLFGQGCESRGFLYSE